MEGPPPFPPRSRQHLTDLPKTRTLHALPQSLDRDAVVCAALCVCAWSAIGGAVGAAEFWSADPSGSSAYQLASSNDDWQYATAPVPAAVELGAWDGNMPLAQPTQVADGPPAERWIAAPADRSPYVETEVYGDPAWEGGTFVQQGPPVPGAGRCCPTD